jgi:hypothetical protein
MIINEIKNINHISLLFNFSVISFIFLYKSNDFYYIKLVWADTFLAIVIIYVLSLAKIPNNYDISYVFNANKLILLLNAFIFFS